MSCFGGTNGSITITGTGGTPGYQYRFGTSAVYSSLNNFSGLRAGTYAINVKDAAGCIITARPVLTQPASAISATFTKTDETCPNAANGSITVIAAGGTAPYTYRYGSTGSFTTTNTFTGLKAGSYRIFVNDANGCTGYSILVAVGNVSATCPSAIPIARAADKPVFAKSENDMQVSLSPNPSGHVFNLRVHTSKQLPVMIRIFDISGKVVQATKGMPEQNIRFGDAFISGTYLVEVRQGEVTKILKAVKN